MSKRRVVITGLGVVTSLGETADEMWDNLCAAKSGIKPVTRFDMSTYPVRFGAECTDFDLTKYAPEVAKYTDDKIQPRRLDRFGQFGIAAA
jgi:3-oxoacyl-[acyl-carrier-protein] synthase II